jgi:sugar phosphate isomerase/epimerase
MSEAMQAIVFRGPGHWALEDFPRIKQELISCDYDGWAIVEQDVDANQPGVQPYESAVRSRRYLRETIAV